MYLYPVHQPDSPTTRRSFHNVCFQKKLDAHSGSNKKFSQLSPYYLSLFLTLLSTFYKIDAVLIAVSLVICGALLSLI